MVHILKHSNLAYGLHSLLFLAVCFVLYVTKQIANDSYPVFNKNWLCFLRYINRLNIVSINNIIIALLWFSETLIHLSEISYEVLV